MQSSLDKFLDNFRPVDFFLGLVFELLDELISFLLAPLVPHGH